MTSEQRTAIYALAASVGLVLKVHGLATDATVSLYISVVMDTIAVYTAFFHRPTKATD